MPRTTLTFTRDSSSDIKSSYTRDTLNDIFTSSVIGEVDVGSTVNYTVGCELYQTKSGSVIINEDTTLDVILEEMPEKTLTISVYDVYNMAGADLIINGVSYSISETETIIPIKIGTNVTIEYPYSSIKVYESSNTNYIPGYGTSFPISFTMPNEDIWFTIYDSRVPT